MTKNASDNTVTDDAFPFLTPCCRACDESSYQAETPKIHNRGNNSLTLPAGIRIKFTPSQHALARDLFLGVLCKVKKRETALCRDDHLSVTQYQQLTACPILTKLCVRIFYESCRASASFVKISSVIDFP
jgi:hypothetical protein